MFIDDDALYVTELTVVIKMKIKHQPPCQGLEVSVPQTLPKIFGYRLSCSTITLY